LDTKVIDEKFPETSHVIPDKSSLKTRLTIDPTVFTKALGRLAKLSSSKSLKFTVNGKLTLEAFDPDTGSAALTVPTMLNTHVGEDLVVGFNAGYLLEALKRAEAPVVISLSDPLSPARVDREDGRTAVVMPLRV
jgi:DNA polymerase III sliding clamp (beta) subunit (PCNA family)